MSLQSSAAVPRPADSQREAYLNDLLKRVSNPVNRRIVEAYRSTGTVGGAEQEFSRALQEVLHED